MFINRMKGLEAELAADELLRRAAGSDELDRGDLDCDAIGMLILDEAMRRTVAELKRFAGIRGEGTLEDLS